MQSHDVVFAADGATCNLIATFTDFCMFPVQHTCCADTSENIDILLKCLQKLSAESGG